jgi:hypothetical protein
VMHYTRRVLHHKQSQAYALHQTHIEYDALHKRELVMHHRYRVNQGHKVMQYTRGGSYLRGIASQA